MKLLDLLDSVPHWLRSALAFACLVGACAIASQTYELKGWIWGSTRVNFTPTLISGIAGLMLVAPLVLADLFILHRREDGPFGTVLNVANALLFVYLASSFAAIATGGTSWLAGPTGLLAIAVLILPLINPGRYAEIAAIALVILGGWNISSANTAMGIWGFALVLLSAVGLLLALDLSRILRRIFQRSLSLESREALPARGPVPPLPRQDQFATLALAPDDPVRAGAADQPHGG